MSGRGDQPKRYACSFVISPNPVECPQGLICRETALPMFYVKFGDGIWDEDQLTEHDSTPSFASSYTAACVYNPEPNSTEYYLLDQPTVAVRPAQYLEAVVLDELKFKRVDIDSEETDSEAWYMIRAPLGVTGSQLAEDLTAISRHMEDATQDFGFKGTLMLWEKNYHIMIQQRTATGVIAKQAKHIKAQLQSRKYF